MFSHFVESLSRYLMSQRGVITICAIVGAFETFK